MMQQVSCIIALHDAELQRLLRTLGFEMNPQLNVMFQAKASKERLDVVKSLMACKPKPRASICAFVLKMKGYFDRGIGSVAAQSTRRTSKTEKLKRVVTKGLKESRRLKHRELNLVMGNRKITLVTRIGKRNYQEESFTHKEEMAPMALSDSEFNLANYKRGLASIEEQLVFYKKNEVIFGDKIAVLKRDVSFKDSDISWLKSELEKVKLEKESYQLKIENFENASKSLDQLLRSQIIDKSRKGVGFVSYNAVPPPHTSHRSRIHSPPIRINCPMWVREFQEPELKAMDQRKVKSAIGVEITVQQSHYIVVRKESGNAFKASSCICDLDSHQTNSASITLKRYDYVDVRGRSRSIMAWVPKKIKLLIKKLEDSEDEHHVSGRIVGIKKPLMKKLDD
ncbi:hypothetical protein Tco_0832163 [Tanacetum coccineum]